MEPTCRNCGRTVDRKAQPVGRKMTKHKLPFRYLSYAPDHRGNPRWYLRLPGRPKIRLHETPGSCEFAAEYSAACEGRHAAVPQRPKREKVIAGSFTELVNDYKTSAEFKRLQLRT